MPKAAPTIVVKACEPLVMSAICAGIAQHKAAYAVLCCPVLSCAVLCCAMLCYLYACGSVEHSVSERLSSWKRPTSVSQIVFGLGL